MLGYGEISLVLAWPADAPRFACKRLPPFGTRARLRRLPLGARRLPRRARRRRGPGRRHRPAGGRARRRDRRRLRGAADPSAVERRPRGAAPSRPGRRRTRWSRALVEAAVGVVGPRLGLDAQLSNWTWDGETLTYIDVSTPLIWDSDGRTRLDLDLLADAFPLADARAAAPLRRARGPRHLPGPSHGLPRPLRQPAQGASRRVAAGVPRPPRTGTSTSRSRRTRSSATTAPTRGCGRRCCGSAGSTAPGSATCAAARTRSCSRARSSASGPQSARSGSIPSPSPATAIVRAREAASASAFAGSARGSAGRTT